MERRTDNPKDHGQPLGDEGLTGGIGRREFLKVAGIAAVAGVSVVRSLFDGNLVPSASAQGSGDAASRAANAAAALARRKSGVTFGIMITLALGILAAPLSSEAQPAKAWRIGLFHVGLDHVPLSLDTLREGLKALGYEERKNIHLDWRNLADEEAARATAQEFVRERVDLIVAFEDQTIRAAKAATSEIPVVFLHASDPVADGYVKSLARPGGNMTGFGGIWFELPDKQLELFKELIPRLRRLLILIDPEDPVTRRLLAKVQRAAEILKLKLVEREATNQADIERVFDSVTPGDVDGVFVVSQTLQLKFSSLLIRLASERRLPFPGYRKEWVEKGALFSYAPDIRVIGRAAAPYIDKILKGTKPGDLPVQLPTQLELVINLKTAKALGLTIPNEILFQADEIIR
ncbi:MAG: ABC transporter substrate-binding protein [candidate division NC10 bacterium]|nr:ABC transporter substrate-binding protein [candidate division NC10 bacterium]